MCTDLSETRAQSLYVDVAVEGSRYVKRVCGSELDIVTDTIYKLTQQIDVSVPK